MAIKPHRLLLGLALLIAATAQAAAGPARPCDTTGDCLPGWECYFPLYGCPQQPGYCVETLPQCDPNSGLVCGCDGETYTSECEAEDLGRNIAHAGVCPSNCGGQTCVGNSFCELPPGICQQGVPPECRISNQQYTRKAELSGTCVPWPATCDQVEDPVCGCNFVTYLNACEAAHALTSINHEGACPGPVCGPLFGGCINPGEVCVDTCVCSGFGIAGLCEPVPTTCDNSCLPVCGCPDVWYRNRCEWLLANPTGLSQAQALGACGEGWGVLFHTKTELAWGGSHSDTYNVYRAAVSGGAPPGPWNCIASGLPADPFQEIADPPSGETWAYIVTTVEAGVTEGPLGWGGNGCVERINATPCPPTGL